MIKPQQLMILMPTEADIPVGAIGRVEASHGNHISMTFEELDIYNRSINKHALGYTNKYISMFTSGNYATYSPEDNVYIQSLFIGEPNNEDTYIGAEVWLGHDVNDPNEPKFYTNFELMQKVMKTILYQSKLIQNHLVKESGIHFENLDNVFSKMDKELKGLRKEKKSQPEFYDYINWKSSYNFQIQSALLGMPVVVK